MARKSISKEEPEIPRSLDPKMSVQLLQKQIKKAEELLAKGPIVSSRHAAWNNTTRDYLIRAFGSESPNVHAVIYASSDVGLHVNMSNAESERYMASLIDNQIKMLRSCIEQLETEIELPVGEESKEKDNFISIVSKICDRFNLVARELRNRHGNRPTLEIEDEYDVQDLIRAILRFFFENIRWEEWTPSYAGGSARMDFLLRSEQIVIEIKNIRWGVRLNY